MDLNILNLSDKKAKISKREVIKWLKFLESKWVNTIFTENQLIDIEKNLSKFNTLAKSDIHKTILVTSWWIESINYFNSLDDKINWCLILIWFSDVLHLMYKYYLNDNVMNIYWLTLRNVFELNNKDWNQLTKLINSNEYKLKLNTIQHDYNDSWFVYGWHILIFLNMILSQKIKVKDSYLYLEFHWLDENFAKYYIDLLNFNWLFNLNKWVILNFHWYNLNKNIIINYLLPLAKNIYHTNTKFFPLFKEIKIEKWNLMLN